MARTPSLAQFRIDPSEDARSIQIHIEDDDGGTLELTATREQLEVLADSLDDFLAETEDADEVDADEDDEAEDEIDDEEDAGDDDGDDGQDAPPPGSRRR